MTQGFFNAPIQNGDFRLSDRPGKAVGIHIAEALNVVQGTPHTPHLWNTVMLSGDRRYRAYADVQESPVDRRHYERGLIAEKYAGCEKTFSNAEVVTDADEGVARFSLEAIEKCLLNGAMELADETVTCCRGCGHMVGTSSVCKSCGSGEQFQRTQRHLVAVRDTQKPVLEREDTYGTVNVRHLSAVASNVPDRLIMSRTRDYGIELGALGLRGLVLDPRTGLHMAVAFAARKSEIENAVMVVTPTAAQNIIAYGQPFRALESARMKYALHGYVPYEAVEGLTERYEQLGMGQQEVALFEQWFLPLYSLAERQNIKVQQVDNLLKFFHKSLRLRRENASIAEEAGEVMSEVRSGSLGWLASKHKIASVMPIEATQKEQVAAE